MIIMPRATLPAGATALARVLEVAVCRVDVCKFVKRLVAYLEAVDRDGESSPADPPRLISVPRRSGMSNKAAWATH